MHIIGLAGGLNTPQENRFRLPFFFHDSAAVLLTDGEPRFAVEEERLNRIKHTTCFPVEATKAALEHAGISLESVEHFAYYFSEAYLNSALSIYHHQLPGSGPATPVRDLIDQHFQSNFGQSVATRLNFIDHHLCHAASAWYPAGFDHGLVLVTDGQGEDVSLSIFEGSASGLTKLDSFDTRNSLGLLYLTTTKHIGFQLFDEYKLMGLAPYGDPSRYRALFNQHCELLAAGRYRLDLKSLTRSLQELCPPRRQGEAITTVHKDIAAAVQATLERLLMHVCRHWQARTGASSIAMAGGVSLNCTFNGKLLQSGLFGEAYVQPAAHDAGCALGAAMQLATNLGEPVRPGENNMFLGSAIGHGNELRRQLERWEPLISIEQPQNLVQASAERLASGQVAGWVQGRSEFGPRALGNRSILADPRSVSQRNRVNQVIKNREGFRPFAPVVLESALHQLYEVPATRASYCAMNYTLATRAQYRNRLGAVSHVDGSARVQTVAPDRQPLLWSLVDSFRSATGVPALLNTSFNNHAEPIVDSVSDAISCFLTTSLDFLVIGEFLLVRRGAPSTGLKHLVCRLLPAVPLQNQGKGFELTHRFRDLTVPVSANAAGILQAEQDQPVERNRRFRQLDEAEATLVLRELFELWRERLICCRHDKEDI